MTFRIARDGGYGAEDTVLILYESDGVVTYLCFVGGEFSVCNLGEEAFEQSYHVVYPDDSDHKDAVHLFLSELYNHLMGL